MLTLERLKEKLHYDPETGAWTCLQSYQKRYIGKHVGHRGTNGYIYVHVDGKQYLAHRLAVFYMTGEWPPQVDHEHFDKCDNRWSEIRPCTQGQNQQHRGKLRNNTSGYKGVCSNGDRHSASIAFDNQRIHLGTFDSAEEAAAAYYEAALEHHGKFATA